MNARRVALVVGVLMMIAPVASTAVVAQESTPSVTLSRADIDVDVGESTTVSATYEFDVTEAESASEQLSQISGTIWTFSDHSVQDITASVNGNEVDTQIEQADRHVSLTVPVENVNDGSTVTVTLNYAVAEPVGELKAPLWVPEYPTGGQTDVVRISATLPEGAQSQGDEFPTLNAINGNTLQFNTIHVPGFVYATYGQDSSGLGTNTLLSVVGIILVLGLTGGGILYDQRSKKATERTQ